MEKLTAEEIVEILYQSILDRYPDSDGLSHYVDMIKSRNGDGIHETIKALIGSPEFLERVKQ